METRGEDIKDVSGAYRRYNTGKVKFHLIPYRPVGMIADVLTYGAHKYSIFKNEEGELIKGSEISIEKAAELELVESGMDNWRKGSSYLDTLGSCLRHIYAWMRNEDFDKESGLHHLAHAGCNILFILEWIIESKGIDDRFKYK